MPQKEIAITRETEKHVTSAILMDFLASYRFFCGSLPVKGHRVLILSRQLTEFSLSNHGFVLIQPFSELASQVTET